jgi:hypothetical protein
MDSISPGVSILSIGVLESCAYDITLVNTKKNKTAIFLRLIKTSKWVMLEIVPAFSIYQYYDFIITQNILSMVF